VDRLIHNIDKQFKSNPDALAVISADCQYTYKDLEESVNQLSEQLTQKNLIKNEIIAVNIRDRYWAIAAIIAIIKHDCGYLPLDPIYPLDRLNYMVENSEVRLLINDNDLLEPPNISVLNLNSGNWKTNNTELTPAPTYEVGYIIYTSGSTGVPKGVMLPRSVLGNLINWQNKRYSDEQIYRTAQFSALSFDVSFQEIFSTLSRGAPLYLIDQRTKQDFASLVEFLVVNKIERIFMPYIALLNMAQWACRLEKYPTDLKEIITAGEQLIANREIRQLLQHCTNARLYNQYGPSETHVVSEYVLPEEVSDWDDIPPIGEAIDGALLTVIDEHRNPVPDGEVGELLISGEVLAVGYKNNDQETRSKFIDIQIYGQTQRGYCTGDLVTKDKQGLLHYKGRIDNQVKINGYRVEITEVEKALMSLNFIDEVAVSIVKESNGQSALIAFVVMPTGKSLDNKIVKQTLSTSLPAYMIPSIYIQKEALATTPSGKIDRKSMIKAWSETTETGTNSRKNLAEDLLQLIRHQLSNADISLQDNLIDMGMDSMGANRLAASCYDQLKIDLPAYRFFQYKTVQSLINFATQSAKKIDNQKRENKESSQSKLKDQVAIIGVALDIPGSNSKESFWQNLAEGNEHVHFFEPLGTNGQVNARGILDAPTGFDAAFFNITPGEAEFLDPQQRKLLELAWHGLEDSGYEPEEFAGRIGVFCGTGNNSYYLNNVLKNQEKMEEFGAFQAMIANEKDYCATRIAHKLNLNGPAINVQSACSTSLVAVCQAVSAIRNGDCDMAIAGAASITYPQQQPYAYEDGGIYSKDGHTRTFDADSNGTVFSDGAGVIVLKRLDYAIDDGDQIIAAIKGVATNNDGAEKGSFSAPSIEGQKRVILAAQDDAGISSEQIGYIEAHGTATPIGDPIEVAALAEAFRVTTGDKNFCALGSVKSNFGHLTSAAGVVGLVKSALAIQHGKIPGNVNFQTPNPALGLESSPFIIANGLTEWGKPIQERIAGISSFGIGGTNAHVILTGVDIPKADDVKSDNIQGDQRPIPFCISAKSKGALNSYINNYQLFIENNPQLPLHDIALATVTQRQAMPFRFSAYAVTRDEIMNKLRNGQKTSAEKVSRLPEVAFLFSGQGTQISGMGRQLYKKLGVFRDTFDQCSVYCQDHGIDLPQLVFNGQGNINETENTQIALFCICYSIQATIAAYGIKPVAMFGHSIGELVAATVSGVFDLETAIKVIVTRGRVMQSQPTGDMAAVRANPEEIIPHLAPGSVVAAINAPDSCTISGPAESLKQSCNNLESVDIANKLLSTSHAFHSPMMNNAASQFSAQLKGITLRAPKVPFISCVTGTWITNEQAVDIEYWANQILAPVQFRAGCETLMARPNIVAVEVGPQQVLSGLLAQSLMASEDELDIPCFTTLAKPAEDNEVEQFVSAISSLWNVGVDISWPEQVNDEQRQVINIPKYPFQRKVFEIQPLLSANPIGSEYSLPTTPLQEATQPVIREINMKDQIITQLKALFSDASGMELQSVSNDASFFELGLDSLFLTQAIMKIKRKFKVVLTFRQLMSDCNSFGLLAEYMENNGAKIDAVPVAPAPEMSQPLPQGIAMQQAVPMAASSQNSDLVGLLTQQMQLINNQITLLGSAFQAPIQTQAAPTEAIAVTDREPTQTRSTKPFGAGVRINAKRTNELSADQQRNLNALVTRYNSKFEKSKSFAQQNRKQLADPRVVSGFRTALKEIIYPIVVERSQGANLWDIDGNRFVDVTCGFGSNFFGNSAEFIKEAISNQLEKGYEIGPQHPLVAEVSAKFCKATNAERVAFCNTGSEAVLGAVRLARTVTSKEHVVMFENDYHGINDEVIVHRGGDGHASPAAAGVPEAAVANALILDYGESASLTYIKENADSIAAVLVEPVQSRKPSLQPKAFLQALREICDQNEIALIFDEVITGFRIHANGAQGYFGIQADIATYGKIIGGGLPVGVFAGKAKFMDALDGGQWSFGDDSTPDVGVTYFAGTFVRHPLVLAAANAVLDKLAAEPTIQTDLNATTEKMVNELNTYLTEIGSVVKVVHCGSLFRLDIPQDIGYEELIYVLMREKGIHIWDARPCFLTTAHTDEDIKQLVSAIKQSVDEMMAMTFLPAGKQVEADRKINKFDKKNPPVAGAKLGKDPSGNPAWYIADPENAGKYLMVEA